MDADSAQIDVVNATLLEPYQIRITFSDGFVQTVDFGPFLRNSLNLYFPVFDSRWERKCDKE
jgi:hypothetical protein